MARHPGRSPRSWASASTTTSSPTAAATRSSRTRRWRIASSTPSKRSIRRAVAVLRHRARAGTLCDPARDLRHRGASGLGAPRLGDRRDRRRHLPALRARHAAAVRAADVDRRAAREGARADRAAEDAARRRPAAGQAVERDGARRDRLDAVAVRRGHRRGARRSSARARPRCSTRDRVRGRARRARRTTRRGCASSWSAPTRTTRSAATSTTSLSDCAPSTA